MLNELTRLNGSVQAVRLVAPARAYNEILNEMGISPEDFEENIEYFDSLHASPRKHLEWIFDHRGQRDPGRFNDGTFPVLYTALDCETAEAEKARYLSVLSLPHYFQQLQVQFEGDYLSLFDLAPVPSFLTGEANTGAYDQCQAIAREAITLSQHAFITPSARKLYGRCFPIFSKEAIQGLVTASYVRFDYDQTEARWSCKSLR